MGWDGLGKIKYDSSENLNFLYFSLGNVYTRQENSKDKVRGPGTSG